MNERIDKLRTKLAEEELDAFLVTDGRNRRYMSGFTGSSGVLLITRDDCYVITDFRYFEQVGRQAPDWRLWKQNGNLVEAVCALLNKIDPTRLGFEADALMVSDYRKYQEKAPDGIEWVPTESVIGRMRAVKHDAEVELIRSAQRITDEAGRRLPQLIQPGRTEKQVAYELEKLMRDLGADGPAFDVIVASGPNSALPHYHPADRVIQKDEIVLVDFGARLGGYHSDMTRTFFTGEPPEAYRRIYQVVLDALHRAEQEIRAGLLARQADLLARDLIGEYGHRDDFGHSLGHGVGLDIHELPSLSYRANEEERLEPGAIVTIEPGIYRPGWGGVRIEDLALITEDGTDVFTTTTKDIDAWRQGQS